MILGIVVGMLFVHMLIVVVALVSVILREIHGYTAWKSGGSIKVVYPKKGPERPKVLEEVLRTISEETAGEPLVGDKVETPVW